MEPRQPPFLIEPDPTDPDTDEPIEVADYYEAMEAEWLRSDADADLDGGVNPEVSSEE